MSHRLLISILTWLLLPALVLAGDKDMRDEVVTNKGKVYNGRVLERYGPEFLVLYQGTKSKEIPLDDVAKVTTVRDRLEIFLSERKQGLSIDEEWKLVQRALELELPEMARVQAYHVLTLDAGHDRAHAFVGNKKSGKRWLLGKRHYDLDEFHKRLQNWNNRFKLSSEHWDLETNVSVMDAVNILMDLERFYLFWMDQVGEGLLAGERVLDPANRMKINVMHDRKDKGFTTPLDSRREAYYFPMQWDATSSVGSINTIYTFFRDGKGKYPERIFDLAAQQLLYSNLLFARYKGSAPTSMYGRNAHWAELGIGFWLGNRFGGIPGYGKEQPFQPGPECRRLAQVSTRGSRMHSNKGEVVNLIGMPHAAYYSLGSSSKIGKEDRSSVYRAKARSFFLFLMLADPSALDRRGKPAGSARDGLYYYLRETFNTPRGHSSKTMDTGLGGKVETLQAPWEEWRESHP